MDNTFRVISLNDGSLTGDTAVSPEIAKIAARVFGDDRTERLAVERTDWERNAEKRLFARRKIVVEVEATANEWTLGA